MQGKDIEGSNVVPSGPGGQAREARLRQKFEDSLRLYKRSFLPAKIAFGIFLFLSAITAFLLIGGGFLTVSGTLLVVGLGMPAVISVIWTGMNGVDNANSRGQILVQNACQLIEQIHVNHNPEAYTSLLHQHLQAQEMLRGCMKNWPYKKIVSLIDENMPKIRVKSSLDERRHQARIAILEVLAVDDQGFFEKKS